MMPLKTLLPLVLLIAACGSRGAVWDRRLDVVGPITAAGQLVWLERGAGSLTVLDPTSSRPPRTLELSTLPRGLAATSAGVVVVGGKGNAPTLEVVSLPGGERHTSTIAGAYDRIATSSDGRFAMLFYDPNVAPAIGGPAARNNNEVTIADLPAGTSRTFSLGTESLAPQSVLFSPDNAVAAILLDSAVVFLQLAQPDVRVQVPLKLPAGDSLHPKKALFSPDSRYLYVQTTEVSDVLALDVVRGEGQISSAVNFLFFPGGTTLRDMIVPQGLGFERYVAVLYSDAKTSQAVLLDATGDTSRTHSADFTKPATKFLDLDNGQLLVYGETNSSFIGGWLPLLDRSDEDALQGAVIGTPQVGGGKAFISHRAVANASNSAAMTSASLSDDGSRVRVKLNPIVLAGAPTASVIDSVTGTLFLNVSVSRTDSGAAPALDTNNTNEGDLIGSLVSVRAETLAIGGLPLDAAVTGLGVVGDFVYAQHAGIAGDITFVPTASMDREHAHRVKGFLAGHLLDRGEEVSP